MAALFELCHSVANPDNIDPTHPSDFIWGALSDFKLRNIEISKEL